MTTHVRVGACAAAGVALAGALLAGCGGGGSSSTKNDQAVATTATGAATRVSAGPSGAGDAVTVKLFAFQPSTWP